MVDRDYEWMFESVDNVQSMPIMNANEDHAIIFDTFAFGNSKWLYPDFVRNQWTSPELRKDDFIATAEINLGGGHGEYKQFEGQPSDIQVEVNDENLTENYWGSTHVTTSRTVFVTIILDLKYFH